MYERVRQLSRPIMLVLVTLVFLTGAGSRSRAAPNAAVALNGVYPVAIACPAANTCYITGNKYSPKPRSVIVMSHTGVSWSTMQTAVNLDLSGIACPGVNRCYALERQNSTSRQFILSTGDGGKSWQRQPFPITRGVFIYLTAIACPALLTCYVAGTSAVPGVSGRPPNFTPILLTTSDGGKNWRRGSLAGSGVAPLRVLACPNASTCYAGGWKKAPDCAMTGVILATTDAGKTWRREYSDCAVAITALACTDRVICYAGGYYGRVNDNGKRLIVATTDGMSWHEQNEDNHTQPNSYVKGPISGVACPVAGTCIAAAQEQILRTQDGGDTWRARTSTRVPGSFLTAVTCAGLAACYAIGTTSTGAPNQRSFGFILQSLDGGLTWTRK